ncbi:MAG: type IV pilus modification PilV family protein [Longimicrobiales bacterium]
MVTRRGFGLVEVVVALTLVGVALLGVAGSALLAGTLLRQAEASERGAMEALQVIDSLAQTSTPSSGERSTDRFHISWRVSPDSSGLQQLDVAVSYADGNASHSAAYRIVLASRQP